ncbi:MAG: Calx-beta domain-containing protein [Aggregatilineales bacterium]
MSSQLLDNYRLERVLGEGKTGTVYLATDTVNNTTVALKRIHPNLARDSRFRDLFAQTAQALEQLDHPNVVRVLHHAYAPDATYLVMEYISGGDLRNQLATMRQQGRGFEPDAAITLTGQIADGLQYAHGRRIVHYDLKPTNILMKGTQDSTRKTPVISDFGLTKLTESVRGSGSMQFFNTYAYMSPEQVRGERVDARTDVYSLGVILYELVTGRVPFVPRSVNEAVNMHTRSIIPPPSQLRPGIQPDLERIILKSLARNPMERFQSPGEMMGALRQYQVGGPSVVRTAPEAPPRQINTHYASQPAAPLQIPRFERPPAQPADVGRARVAYAKENEQPAFAWLDKSVTNLGRDATNDITLEGEQVSRYHARIDRDSNGHFRIMDPQGSTNGVWLGATRLPPSEPRVWQPGQIVRIGEYWLTLEIINTPQANRGAVAGAVAGVGALAVAGRVGNPANEPQNMTDRISVRLLENVVAVVPGERRVVRMDVQNEGKDTDHFALELHGLPPEWYTIPMDALHLLPERRGTLQMAIHPPRESEVYVGTHNFDVIIRSQMNRAEYISRPMKLEVSPFYGMDTQMQARRFRDDGFTYLNIINTGNAPDNYTVAVEDASAGLVVRPEPTQIAVEPGQTDHVLIRTLNDKRRFVGVSKAYPFRLSVTPESGAVQPQMQTAEAISEPVFSAWVVALSGLGLTACLFILLLSLLAFGADRGGTGDSDSGSSSGGSGGGNANTATPDLRQLDTDGDGLSDYDEINSHGTNPNDRDSDDDNLNDGYEINTSRTNPLNPDTDGDGFPDGADPNPLATPPPTPDVISSQAAASGQTLAAATQDAIANPSPTITPSPTGTPTPTATPILPAISVNDPPVATEGTLPTSAVIIFTVSLDRPNPGPDAIKVNYATVPGTAADGTDFTAANGTLTFAVGEQLKTVSVSVTSDASPEIPSPETFTFVLSGNSPNATIAKGTGIGMIADDDVALPAISISDASGFEGDTGCAGGFTPLNFNLSLLGVDPGGVQVSYSVPASTQYTAGTANPVPVTAAGGTITINLTCDDLPEADQTFNVFLFSPQNATLSRNSAVGTIRNDDAGAIVLDIASPAMPIAEAVGTVSVDVSISAANPGPFPITVNYATVNGSATASSDYTATSGTLSFPSGSAAAQTITVPLVDDGITEPDETFTIVLSNPVGANIGTGTASVVIQNDDVAPVITVNFNAPTISGTEGTNLIFTVNLDQPNPGPAPINVTYISANGTAISPTHYTAQSGTLTFGTGVATQQIVVPTINDALDNPNRTFAVSLTGAMGATLGGANVATGTIIDDDAPILTVSINDIFIDEDDGIVNFRVSVSPSNLSASPIVINYFTRDVAGSALGGVDCTAPNDYVTVISGLRQINSGGTGVNIPITVCSDAVGEPNEFFEVVLNSVTLADASFTLVIADNVGGATMTD